MEINWMTAGVLDTPKPDDVIYSDSGQLGHQNFKGQGNLESTHLTNVFNLKYLSFPWCYTSPTPEVTIMIDVISNVT